jgi:hypothetical protein
MQLESPTLFATLLEELGETDGLEALGVRTASPSECDLRHREAEQQE